MLPPSARPSPLSGPERSFQVAVCGPRNCTDEQAEAAHRVGELLARAGVTVICGGGTGVMAAVASGARAQGGTVVGIRPGPDTTGASPDLSVTIVTNLGEARNAVIVWSADAVIAVGGSWGTLSEVALARRRGEVPVVVLDGWHVVGKDGELVDAGIAYVDSPEEAVRQALQNA
ncbi:TIGR00725 family protein [Kineosporia mesophila]|uniref:TIGR00725 family protein n=1 Tax=Kineosporia mesophila TaxID=566012 RepID=A0ABP6YWX2_9ACTN|nr:TIGR00725 family protein [Kineosporia mesophila]